MDTLVPPNIERLIPYVPGKPVEELERELGIQNAVKLASNENPLGPSPKVVEAIQRAASQVHFYPDGGAFRLRSALAAHLGVGMDELVIGNGSNELIDMVARTFTSPDAHAVFGHPSFVCYWLACNAANVPFTMVPLRDHLHWDIDAMLAAVRPETRLLYLANPNNPTGAYVGRDDLERLLRELPPEVMAVIDEAYLEFPDADDYCSALELRDIRERLIILRTFSKAYGMASNRVGYAITTPEAADYLNRIRAPFNVGAINQEAALVALQDPEHVQRYLEMNRVERTRVEEGMKALGLEVAPSQANFLLVDFEEPGQEVYEKLLREAVIVRPMPAPIDTWLRITIGTPEQNQRLLAAVKTVLGR